MIQELAMTLSEKKKLYLRAKDAYYAGKPIMTDKKFDALEDEIKDADPKWLKGKTGAPIKNKKMKVKLPIPMFSLDKRKLENVQAWLLAYSKEEVTISDKLDGASLEIVYKKGAPHQAITRGNGTIGGDVSFLLPYMKIPQKVGNESFIIRCEGLFSNAAFNKYKNEFDAARNAASGILNRQDIHPAVRDLSVVVLQVLDPNMKPSQGLAWAKSKGFTVVPFKIFKAGDLSGEKLSKLLKARLAKSKFRMDGLVITLNKINPLPKAGNPAWAIAFKENISVEDAPTATVTSVDWEPSSHGYLKPTANYSPISVDGAKLRRATAYNAKYVVDNKIGPGAVIKVLRSGDIIPKIVEVVKPAKEPSLPDPDKYGSYKWSEKKVDLILVNPTESADVRIKVITRFMTNLEVDFMKEGTVRRMYDSGFTNITKILRATPAKFETIPGVKVATARKLWDAIHAKLDRPIPAVKLMDASGCFPRGLGTTRFQQIADKWDIMKVARLALDDPQRATSALTKLNGWSAKTAAAFIKGAPKFLKWLDVTGLQVTVKAAKVKTKSKKLEGVGVTWTSYRNKDEEQTVIENGGRVESFGSKTSVLLYRPGGKESTKLDKAKAKGIPVMTWDQFAKKYGL